MWLCRRSSVESLFKGLFVFHLADNLIGVDLHFPENVFLVGLSLNFDRLVNHITQLSVSLVKLLVSLHQGLIPRCVWTVLVLKLIYFSLKLFNFFVQLFLILGKLFVGITQLLGYLVGLFDCCVGLVKFWSEVIGLLSQCLVLLL